MSDITPEKVADALSGGDDINEVLNGWVDVSAVGPVASIKFTPVKATEWGGEPDEDNARHFRAVVVEGETVPDLAEVGRLKARLEAAEWTMRKALVEVEHEEVVHLLNRYFAAAEAAQADQSGGQS